MQRDLSLGVSPRRETWQKAHITKSSGSKSRGEGAFNGPGNQPGNSDPRIRDQDPVPVPSPNPGDPPGLLCSPGGMSSRTLSGWTDWMPGLTWSFISAHWRVSNCLPLREETQLPRAGLHRAFLSAWWGLVSVFQQKIWHRAVTVARIRNEWQSKTPYLKQVQHCNIYNILNTY